MYAADHKEYVVPYAYRPWYETPGFEQYLGGGTGEQYDSSGVRMTAYPERREVTWCPSQPPTGIQSGTVDARNFGYGAYGFGWSGTNDAESRIEYPKSPHSFDRNKQQRDCNNRRSQNHDD